MSSGVEVTVIGDLIADVWLTGHAHHLSREAPVPTIHVARREVRPGGAGNAAANLAAQGARTTIVASTGADDTGRALRGALLDWGIDIRVAPLLQRTHAKTRAVVDGQILARIDEIDPLAYQLPMESLPRTGVVLIADYGLGLHHIIDALLPLRPLWSFLAIDSHTPEAWSALAPDLVTPNWSEASALIPPLLDGDRRRHLRLHRQTLLEAANARAALVTMDRDGSALFTRSEWADGWTTPVPERFTIGAGDSATAAALISLAGGADLQEAVTMAAAAARCATQHEGTTVVSALDVDRELQTSIDIRDTSPAQHS